MNRTTPKRVEKPLLKRNYILAYFGSGMRKIVLKVVNVNEIDNMVRLYYDGFESNAGNLAGTISINSPELHKVNSIIDG